MELIDKYLGEATMQGWSKADSRTKDLIDGAVYMRRYHGYDLTIANRDGKWIPVHGGTEKKAERSADKAGLVLIKYVDKLPAKSKIMGDMG